MHAACGRNRLLPAACRASSHCWRVRRWLLLAHRRWRSCSCGCRGTASCPPCWHAKVGVNVHRRGLRPARQHRGSGCCQLLRLSLDRALVAAALCSSSCRCTPVGCRGLPALRLGCAAPRMTTARGGCSGAGWLLCQQGLAEWLPGQGQRHVQREYDARVVAAGQALAARKTTEGVRRRRLALGGGLKFVGQHGWEARSRLGAWVALNRSSCWLLEGLQARRHTGRGEARPGQARGGELTRARTLRQNMLEAAS